MRSIVEAVLTKERTKKLWTTNYYPALPITPQDFDIGALLPTMLYLARFGHRRGKGRFVATFDAQSDHAKGLPTVVSVASTLLSQQRQYFQGFAGEEGGTILGDLLLSWCLENRKHSEGHKEQVQRIFPTHYFASWIDLPEQAIHLRNVPELLTSLLARQVEGRFLEPGTGGLFKIGVADFSENTLLALLGRDCTISGQHAANLAADTFSEEAEDIGIDELLAIRMAMACGRAPNPPPAASDRPIPNWSPLARRAADGLRDDVSVFVSVYGGQMPRQAFLRALEAGIGLGLVNLLLSTAIIVDDWRRTSEIPEPADQAAIPLFVDASQGQDATLRQSSENSVAECLRRYSRLPGGMMLLRVLDEAASSDEDLMGNLPPEGPNPTARIRFLGNLLHGSVSGQELDWRRLKRDCKTLADALENEDLSDEVVHTLRQVERNPAERLAEALCALMGEKQQSVKFRQAFDSALLIDRPNGLAVRRHKSKGTDARSIVLSSAALDFLVHRHVRNPVDGNSLVPLSLAAFFDLLRDRYGLYVDRAPPGLPMPVDLLRKNKEWMERRLRDLGLWIGVNDSESMKQLRPRYCGEGQGHV